MCRASLPNSFSFSKKRKLAVNLWVTNMLLFLFFHLSSTRPKGHPPPKKTKQQLLLLVLLLLLLPYH